MQCLSVKEAGHAGQGKYTHWVIVKEMKDICRTAYSVLKRCIGKVSANAKKWNVGGGTRGRGRGRAKSRDTIKAEMHGLCYRVATSEEGIVLRGAGAIHENAPSTLLCEVQLACLVFEMWGRPAVARALETGLKNKTMARGVGDRGALANPAVGAVAGGPVAAPPPPPAAPPAAAAMPPHVEGVNLELGAGAVCGLGQDQVVIGGPEQQQEQKRGDKEGLQIQHQELDDPQGLGKRQPSEANCNGIVEPSESQGGGARKGTLAAQQREQQHLHQGEHLRVATLQEADCEGPTECEFEWKVGRKRQLDLPVQQKQPEKRLSIATLHEGLSQLMQKQRGVLTGQEQEVNGIGVAQQQAGQPEEVMEKDLQLQQQQQQQQPQQLQHLQQQKQQMKQQQQQQQLQHLHQQKQHEQQMKQQQQQQQQLLERHEQQMQQLKQQHAEELLALERRLNKQPEQLVTQLKQQLRGNERDCKEKTQQLQTCQQQLALEKEEHQQLQQELENIAVGHAQELQGLRSQLGEKERECQRALRQKQEVEERVEQQAMEIERRAVALGDVMRGIRDGGS